MTSKRTWPIVFGALFLLRWCTGTGLCSNIVTAPGGSSNDSSAEVSSIPSGTVITMQNWRDYQSFMPNGMNALFEGKYFWKMPPDVQMQVGPTVLNPLPKNYLAATESYSSQVKTIELPGGGLTLQGYRGGIPFPNPQEPHRAWKILMNLWYRYSQRLLVITRVWVCAIDSSSNSSCKTLQVVGRQLSYNTESQRFPGSAVAHGALLHNMGYVPQP